MMGTIWDIHVDIQELLMGLAKAIEDGDEDVEKLYRDTLESVGFEFEDKLEGCCKFIRNQEAESKMLKEEAKHLTDRAKACDNRAKSTKGLIEFCMNSLGIEKINAGIFKVAMQKNGGKRPINILVDAESLPAEFQKVTVEADNDAIRTALDNGYEGDLFQYGEQGRSLRIR